MRTFNHRNITGRMDAMDATKHETVNPLGTGSLMDEKYLLNCPYCTAKQKHVVTNRLIIYQCGARFVMDSQTEKWDWFIPPEEYVANAANAVKAIVANAPVEGPTVEPPPVAIPAPATVADPAPATAMKWVNHPSRSDSDLHGAIVAAVSITLSQLGPQMVEAMATNIASTLKTGKVPA